MSPDPIEVIAQRLEPVGVEGIDPLGALRLIHHQVGVLEDAQMLRDRRPADRKMPRELADRHRLVHQPREDGAAGGVAESIELRFLVSNH